MCYAIPGRVKKVREGTVIVDYFGEERKARNEMIELRPGDYIYAQGGYVIRKVSELEAREMLEAWREMFFALQDVDVRLSKMDDSVPGTDAQLNRILDRTMQGVPLKKEDILYLLNCRGESRLALIFKTANFLRQKYLKNSCCVHGILEISNHCAQSCAYCGISRHNASLVPYRMTRAEIVGYATEAVEKYGFKALVLQRGEDPGYSVDELAEAVREIKSKAPALILVSFGEVGIDGLEQLYRAGARGLLMRFETSNPKLYEKLRPGCSLESRLLHLRKAYEMGYLIITGGLVGLPGQTSEDIANDLYLCKELHAEMYSFGPFLPHPGTPLAGVTPVNESEMLKVIAAARLVDYQEARVLITTAFETLSPQAREKGLLAGGNSVMLNVTPVSYRRQYSIYPNRAYQDEPVQKQIDEAIALLGRLGRAPTDLGIR